MSSESKSIEQLGSIKYIYKKAKSSFEEHSKNCEYQYIGPSGKKKCSHPESGGACELEVCPKLKGEQK